MNFKTVPRAVFFGEVVYPPGGTWGPHIQRSYQVVMINQGFLNLRMDKENIPVGPGQAILLTPGQHILYQFSSDSDTHQGWCSIKSAALPAKMRPIFGSLRKPAPFDSHLSALFKLGKETLSGPEGALSESLSLGLGLSVLCGFALAAQAGPPAKGPGDEALARLEEFISREYGQPLQLGHMAAAAGVSRQHLLRLFRERHWPTPTARLYQKRLEAAADLLSHTGLSVAEIADRCGFACAFHFSKKFRKVYGKSPREWRAEAWQEDS